MRRFAQLGVCVLLAAILFLPDSRARFAAPPIGVIRVTCLPSRPLALSVAMEQGLFAKQGVEVQVQVAANSEELRGALAAGNVDFAHAAVDNAVALAEKAHVDVVVVMGGEGSTNELIAQPGISSIESLRGRTVIVDAPTTAYAIQLKKILLLKGLQVERDYQIKAIGGTPMRLAAMRENKEYAASILGPPTSLIAKHEGFTSLGSTRELLGPYQAVGGFAGRRWAEENRGALTGYMAAFIAAQRWILNPAHKEQVIALLSREYKLPESLAKEAYDGWIVAPGGFEPDAKIDVEGFANVLHLRAEIEHTWSGTTPGVEKYCDGSFYEEAMRKVAAAQ